MEYILSFDIAKGKSVYCFIDEKKNIIIEPTSINHNKKEFDLTIKTTQGTLTINKYRVIAYKTFNQEYPVCKMVVKLI